MNLRKWSPTNLFILLGLIAIVFGFISAFAELIMNIPKTRFQGKISVENMYQHYDEFSILFNKTYMHHLGMAYVGGITVGSLGIISVMMGMITWRFNALDNNWYQKKEPIFLWISIIFGVALLSLSIAVIVCHSQIGDNSFITNNSKILVK